LDLKETQVGLSKRFQQAIKDLDSYGNTMVQNNQFHTFRDLQQELNIPHNIKAKT